MQSNNLYAIVKDEHGKTILEKQKPRYRIHIMNYNEISIRSNEHRIKWNHLYDKGFRSYYFNKGYTVLSKRIC
jgi:hypothetical protein